MNRLPFAVMAAFGLSAMISANPINPYALPFISEVLKNDSTNWHIELDNKNYAGRLNLSFNYRPCSTSVLKLRLASSKKIFNTRILFDTATGIGVINRESITGIPQQEQVVIKDHDTIQILDTVRYDTLYGYTCWRFAVRPIKAGNSLVNCNGCAEPFETTRPSIGSRGNYATAYDLIILDSYGNPLSRVFSYIKKYTYTVSNDLVYFERKYTAPEVITVPVGLGNNEWRGFSCDSIEAFPAKWMLPSSFPATKWTGVYIDTIVSIKDTIAIQNTSISNKQAIHNLNRIKISTFCSSGKNVTIVIIAPPGLNGALIKIFSMSGKELVILPIPGFINGGTFSVVWPKKQNRTAGRYLCNLYLCNSLFISQTIIVK